MTTNELDTRTAEELQAALVVALNNRTGGGESIDRLSLLLLRRMVADRHPAADTMILDWGDSGLSICGVYAADGTQIEDYDSDDETYLEDPWALASNAQVVSYIRDLLEGPKNGPLTLRLR